MQSPSVGLDGSRVVDPPAHRLSNVASPPGLPASFDCGTRDGLNPGDPGT